jgi:hypothetical protein
VAEALGLGAGVDDVRVVGDAVDDGFREPRVEEYAGPFAERQLRGHDQRSAFAALADDSEDGLGGPVGQGYVAEFVGLCGYPHSSAYAETATMPICAPPVR